MSVFHYLTACFCGSGRHRPCSPAGPAAVAAKDRAQRAQRAALLREYQECLDQLLRHLAQHSEAVEGTADEPMMTAAAAAAAAAAAVAEVSGLLSALRKIDDTAREHLGESWQGDAEGAIARAAGTAAGKAVLTAMQGAPGWLRLTRRVADAPFLHEQLQQVGEMLAKAASKASNREREQAARTVGEYCKQMADWLMPRDPRRTALHVPLPDVGRIERLAASNPDALAGLDVTPLLTAHALLLRVQRLAPGSLLLRRCILELDAVHQALCEPGRVDLVAAGWRLARIGRLAGTFGHDARTTGVTLSIALGNDLVKLNRLLKREAPGVRGVDPAMALATGKTWANTLRTVQELAAVQSVLGSEHDLLDARVRRELHRTVAGIGHLLAPEQLHQLSQCRVADSGLPALADSCLRIQRALQALRQVPDSAATYLRWLRRLEHECARNDLLLGDLPGERAASGMLPSNNAQVRRAQRMQALYRSQVARHPDTDTSALQRRLERSEFGGCLQALDRLTPMVRGALPDWADRGVAGTLEDAMMAWSATGAMALAELAQRNQRAVRIDPRIGGRRKAIEAAVRDALGIDISIDRHGMPAIRSIPGVTFIVGEGANARLARVCSEDFDAAGRTIILDKLNRSPEESLVRRARVSFASGEWFDVSDGWLQDVGRAAMSANDTRLPRGPLGDGSVATGAAEPAGSAIVAEAPSRLTSLYRSGCAALLRFLNELLRICAGDRAALFRATQQLNQATQAGLLEAEIRAGYGSFGHGCLQDGKTARRLRGGGAGDSDSDHDDLGGGTRHACWRGRDGSLHFASSELKRNVDRLLHFRGAGGVGQVFDPLRSGCGVSIEWKLGPDGQATLLGARRCHVLVEGAEPASAPDVAQPEAEMRRTA